MKKILLVLFVVVIVVFLFIGSDSVESFINNNFRSTSIVSEDSEGEIVNTGKFRNFKTDISNASIDLTEVLSGGPGKDGIPAINDPIFESLTETEFDDEALGIFVEIDEDERFYPFNILVWHEIVNDTVGGEEISVTFCPLCGSSIVFSRRVNGEVLDFGVSGFLNESNLLMYDKQTETLWSQARGEGVIGAHNEMALHKIPMQRLSLGEVRKLHPKAKVLSKETGFGRNYDRVPYGNYDEVEDLYFPVSIQDEQFFAKDLMLVVPVKGTFVAFPWNTLIDEQKASIEVEGVKLSLTLDGSEVTIDYEGETLPSYYEMWFSFAIHHQNDSLIWNK